MQVEFVGLPGCGKTTVAIQLEKQLRAKGFNAQGQRNAAKSVLDGIRDKIGFLRNRGERSSLYGCFMFAHKNPDLFNWMFRMSHDDFAALIWGMEAMSQIGILDKHGAEDLIVLNDEGFLQRLSWNFMNLSDQPAIDEISSLLPDDFLTVHLTLPTEEALHRTRTRKKGTPKPLRGRSASEILQKFACYSDMQDQFVEARRKRGCTVVTVDAQGDLKTVTKAVMKGLQRHLPAVAERRNRNCFFTEDAVWA